MDGLSVYGWRLFRRGNGNYYSKAIRINCRLDGKLMFCFINSEKFKISTIQW